MSGFLHTDRFPKFRSVVKASWAPLFIAPIEGSYERLVFGVVVVSAKDYHIETANRLDRLYCLYDDAADAVTSAIEFAVRGIELDLQRRSEAAIFEPNLVVSGVSIGPIRMGEGESLSQIAKAWLRSLSSLYDDETEVLGREVILEMPSVAVRTSSADRLPVLIKDYVTARRPGLIDFFAEDVVMDRRRRSAKRGAEVAIDFAGSKLVANFGTLNANQLTTSANRIKTRLWELKVNRDADYNFGRDRKHEMLVQSPLKNDPQFSAKQLRNVSAALKELVDQADQEELRLISLNSVESIGERLLQLEAA